MLFSRLNKLEPSKLKDKYNVSISHGDIDDIGWLFHKELSKNPKIYSFTFRSLKRSFSLNSNENTFFQSKKNNRIDIRGSVTHSISDIVDVVAGHERLESLHDTDCSFELAYKRVQGRFMVKEGSLRLLFEDSGQVYQKWCDDGLGVLDSGSYFHLSSGDSCMACDDIPPTYLRQELLKLS